jgi:hypothetical protein
MGQQEYKARHEPKINMSSMIQNRRASEQDGMYQESREREVFQ